MKNSLIAIAVFIFLGCESIPKNPTLFVSEGKDSYGYKIETADGMAISRFEGNSDTKPFNALLYSALAAYQYCKEQGQHTFPFGNPKEYSQKSTHTEVYSTQSYNYAGQPQTDVRSYPVTTTFPKYAVAFMCFNKMISLPEVGNLEEISRELVHPVKKDFKGGLLITKGVKDSPLKEGDAILSLGKSRVSTFVTYENAKKNLREGAVEIEIIRENKIKTVKIKAKDITAKTVDDSEHLLKTYCSHLEKNNPLPVCKPEWLDTHSKKTSSNTN